MQTSRIEDVSVSSRSPNFNWVVPAAVMTGITFAGGATLCLDDLANRSEKSLSSNSEIPSEQRNTSSASEEAKSFIAGWQPDVQASEWYFDLNDRLLQLSQKEDGWKGEKSVAPSREARKAASEMISKLAHEGVERRPSIGLDYEGTFSLNWMDDKLSADLTVYEDGTYSFFATSDGRSAMADEERISEPLNGRLLSFLLG